MANNVTISALGFNGSLNLGAMGFSSGEVISGSAPPSGNTVQNIFFGSTAPTSIYVGSTAVSAVYVGSTLVWES